MWVSDVESATAVRHYTVTRAGDGALLVQACMVWGTMDLRTEQPTHIPSTFLADLAPNIAGGLP